MADVFISCSRLDRARIGFLTERLTSLGYSLWIDERTRTDQAFSDEVEREFDAAAAVLAIWSGEARDSTAAFAAAARALDTGKLLQCRIDRAAPPAPFDALPIADISAERPEWGPLEDALQRIVRKGEPGLSLASAPPGVFATPVAAGAPKLLAGALIAVLAAFAIALSAVSRGVMGPEQTQIVLLGVFIVALICAVLSGQRLRAILRAGG